MAGPGQCLGRSQAVIGQAGVGASDACQDAQDAGSWFRLLMSAWEDVTTSVMALVTSGWTSSHIRGGVTVTCDVMRQRDTGS